MRILVAEDSEANRELLTEMLKTRGHFVVGVGGGREALARLRAENFDIILMDEEMPGMNGIEATRAIHRMNDPSRKHSIIIGLSGNSAAEDEKRCLEAGMDAFLAKPICMETLFQVIDLVTPWPMRDPPPKAPSAELDAPPADLAAHLRRATGGNKRLLQSLVKTFLADTPKKLSTIGRAVTRKNAEALARAAHLLKGTLGIFDAREAVAAARNLQAMGRAGDLRGAELTYRALEEQFERLKRALLALRREAKLQRKRKPRPRCPASRPRRKK